MFKVIAKETLNQWKVSENLELYVKETANAFIPDKMLKEQILINNPVPSNIPETHQLDPFVEDMAKSHRKYLVENDMKLERIGRKIRDEYGPLSKVWEQIEGYKEGHGKKSLNISKTATCLEQTVTLLGQAAGAVTYNRRRELLKGLNSNKNQTNRMLNTDFAEELKESNEFLFGTKFKHRIEKDAKSKGQKLDSFLCPPQDSRKRQPFSTSSPQPMPRGGGRQQGTQQPRKSWPI